MRIPIDRQSEIPLYQQIYNHLRQGILSGGLAAGMRLPASRMLAHDLGVNRITVENAYAELETDGLVASRVGSGTYVLPLESSMPVLRISPREGWPLWQQELLDQFSSSAQSLPNAARRDMIDFSSGSGDAQHFPVDEFRKVMQDVMRRDGKAALEYGDIAGYLPLRQTIAQILSSQGLSLRAENLLVTAGSQQAIALTAQALLRTGDVVMVENPTYLRALDLFRMLRLKIVGVPLDQEGMVVEKLEPLLQQYHPKLIYTIPNFQNPSGTCLNGMRRRQLIELADRYNVPILEDDYTGDLRYEGRAQPALKSLDPGGRVIYTSTFSKMLMPGLRVGFLAAEGPAYELLTACKQVNDLASSSLMQRALEAYVSVGRYQAHLRRSILLYRKRRDALLEAAARFLPKEMEYVIPQGGLFLWMRLPEPISSRALLPVAQEEGVSFAPGDSFFADPLQGEPYLRINITQHDGAESTEGMRRMANAIRKLT